MLVVCIYIPCQEVARRTGLDRICVFLRRERENNLFTEIVAMSDLNGVPSQIHRHLRARQLQPSEELLVFQRATRFISGNAICGRYIDYFVFLKDGIIRRQTVRRDIDLSDHYPVSVEISFPHAGAEPEKLIYNRKKPQVRGGAADQIINDNRWSICQSKDVSANP